MDPTDDRRRTPDVHNELYSIKELLLLRFNGTDARLDGLADQLAAADARLREAEMSIASTKPRLDMVAKNIHDITQEHGANRRVVLGALSAAVTSMAATLLRWAKDQ